MRRIPVFSLMILIGVFALGLAAMRNASPLWESIGFTLLLIILSVALLGAMVRRGDGAWVGFALFGWGYALLTFIPAVNHEVTPHLLTTMLLDRLVKELCTSSATKPTLPKLNNAFMEQAGDLRMSLEGLSELRGPRGDLLSAMERHGDLLSASEQQELENYFVQDQAYQLQMHYLYYRTLASPRIGHMLLALALALAGAALGRLLQRGRAPRPAT